MRRTMLVDHRAAEPGRLRACGWEPTPVAGVAEIGDVLASRPGSGHVLIVPSPDTSVADLATLARASVRTRTPIGLLATWAGARVTRAQTEKLAGPGEPAHDGVLGWSQFGFGGLPPGEFGATRILAAEDASSAHALAAGHRLVGLASHSNGIDGPVAGSVACSLPADPVADGADFLPCGQGGPCLRSSQHDGVLSPPRRDGMHDLSADAIIWATCWGVLATGSTFSPWYSLAANVLASPGVGTLLTTFKSPMLNDHLLLYAMALVRSGHTLGQVCLRLNQVEMRRHGHPSWLLLGDPGRRLWPRRPAVRASKDTPGPPAAIETGDIRLIDAGATATELLLAHDANPGPRSEEALYVRRIAGTRHGVAINTGTSTTTWRFQAHRDHRVFPPAGVITAIWDSVPQLAFTRRFLDLAAKSDRAARAPVPPVLREAMAVSLDYHLAAESGRHRDDSVLDGPADRLGRLAHEEGTRWRNLNHALATYLAEYCRGVGSVIEFTYGAGCLGWRVPETDGGCRYCGMPLEVKGTTVPLTGHTRRRTWCYRCALVSDVSAGCTGLWLDGPYDAPAGHALTYSLRSTKPFATPGRRSLAASLVFEYVPWNMGEGEAQVTDLTWDPEGDGELDIALDLKVPHDTPPGVYFIAAAVAAHGDLWVARRPVRVSAISPRT